ncbi:MAG: putative DNA-binding domain-containing protein [Sulfuritalea sp.]|nr:putative DNA-binding domain-containing protein [Sulfuritalea sp.]
MSASLQCQQQAFALAITAEGDWTGLLRPSSDGKPPLLHLYRHAYRSRLTEALRENYPVLHRVLGDKEFDRVAAAFVTACPSRRPSIRWFGDELAVYLEREPQQIPHPALIDLVRMEWALGIAFDGAEAPVLRVNALTQLPAEDWPALRFRPHPTLALLYLDWAVEALWSAVSADPEADTDPPEALPHHLLVWRRDQRTQWRSVTDEEAELLAACLTGKPFAELCAAAVERHGDQAAASVAGFLRAWVESGMLSGLQ